MSFRLVLALVLVGGVLPCFSDFAKAYRPPDLEKEIFDAGAVELDRFDRSGAVNSLVSVARDFDEEDEVDYDLRSHALAIAARLDADSERVKTALEQLNETGKTVSESADKSRVSRRLFSAIRVLTRKDDNEANLICAAYIADIAYRLDPGGQYAERIAAQRDELAEAGHEADWEDMLGRPVARVRNPWEQEEVVFEKREVDMPGGEAERFGQSQSRVHGLVVRQLGNGNLAGSASAINATALRESDVEDLLFTFNQDVGPMMGGSLEEVIKFLRIRYERERDKIPAGYKIDLGFQNKYVPKDGPSAAAAFALVLDSLFSGEELDDDFACTGDMTADGRVQRIGGSAAKIRGATRRGCQIVGIPLDNAKEIGDVLILDGIDQLLEIQIFTLEDFEEAHAIAIKEKSESVVETLELFDEVAAVVKDGGEDMLSNPNVRERLEAVIKRMPNHLSAQLLLQHGKGTSPDVLTVGGTLNQIEIATSGTLQTVGREMFRLRIDDDAEGVEFDREAVESATEAAAELETLAAAIDPRLKDYHEAVSKLCASVVEGAADDEDAGEYGDRVEAELDRIQSAYRKLMEDPEILEEMGV